jgi:hypothetical protein
MKNKAQAEEAEVRGVPSDPRMPNLSQTFYLILEDTS